MSVQNQCAKKSAAECVCQRKRKQCLGLALADDADQASAHVHTITDDYMQVRSSAHAASHARKHLSRRQC